MCEASLQITEFHSTASSEDVRTYRPTINIYICNTNEKKC